MEGDTAGLSPAQMDRATGAMVGLAVGNALGSGYAFQPKPHPLEIRMLPGGLGPYALGEWADDTAMALPILQAAADGRDLLDPATQDAVAAAWVEWSMDAKDAAPLISKVLAAHDPALGAESLRRAAAVLHASGSSGAGNASLMRTTPVAVAYLDDAEATARAARTYSDLTHGNPTAAEACILWNLAQREAILTGRFDIRAGIAHLPESRRAYWEDLFVQAESGMPQDFAIRNGWSPQMVQHVWSAIVHCEQTGPEHLEQTLRQVIAAGGDTPTAAAIAGSLLGARWGVSAIPLQWRRHVHGWPGLRDKDLVQLVDEAVTGRRWPATFAKGPLSLPPIAHPADAGLWLGGSRGLRPLPGHIDAVVSLCRLGVDQEPVPTLNPPDHVRVWLIDSPDPDDNPNLEHVAEQTVAMVLNLRAEGRQVYLHCNDGRSRTPFIASLYGARFTDAPADEVLLAIQRLAPQAHPNPTFLRMIHTFV